MGIELLQHRAKTGALTKHPKITRGAMWPMEHRREVFAALVDKTDTCWLWNGPVDTWGYGIFCWNGKASTAHRFAFLMEHGALPKSARIRQSCKNKKCVNPAHLVAKSSLAKMSTEDRIAYFWSMVERRADNECWLWNGAKSKQTGYGHFLPRTSAHRFSFLLTHGGIREGMYVCHHCDNPPCVNPNHLFEGTAKDNNDDMTKKGRARRGHHGNISHDDVRFIRRIYVPFKMGIRKISELYELPYQSVKAALDPRKWKSIPRES